MKVSRLATALVSTVLLITLAAAGPASAADIGDPDASYGISGIATKYFVDQVEGRVEIEEREGGGIGVGVAVDNTFRVIGYTADGVNDPTFSGGLGIVTVPGSDEVWLAQMTVLGNGKIVLVGRTSGSTENGRMVVARLNADGKPDTSFSGDGVALFSFPKKDATGNGVVPTTRGKLIVVGEVSPVNGSRCDTGVIRINRNGSLDRTFGRRGRVVVALKDGYKGCDGPWRVVHTGRGKVTMAGWQEAADGSTNTLLIALNANGTLDTRFSGDGILVMNLKRTGDDFAAGLLYSQRKFVIGIAGTWNQPGLVRLTRTGGMDKTFGTKGKAWLTSAAEFGYLQSIALDPWGNILGTGSAPGLPAFRAESWGDLDTAGFTPTGFTTNPGTVAEGSDIMGQSTGNIVVSGVPWPALDVAASTRYWG